MASITVAPAPRSTATTLFFPIAGVLIPVNANSATVAFDMPLLAERFNSSQHLDYGIEVQDASPSTLWKAYLQAGWNGGSTFTGKNSTVINPPPTATVGGAFFGAYAGRRARVAVKLTEPMTLGGTISSTRI
jgi:hypothetical protein